MKLLVVVPGYPSSNSSSYRFVHERVKQYQKYFDVNVFCYNKKLTEDYTYEKVKVYCGNKNKLINHIITNSYDKYAFHFLSLSNARFILKYLKNKKVFIWFHGSDCVSYKRRLAKINYSKDKLKNPKFLYRYLIFVIYYLYRNSKIKLLNNKYKNVSFVFVSEWLKNASEKDLKIKYHNWYVIPNIICSDKFKYKAKTESDRLNVLSINNYSSDIYAGDMISDIILKLKEYKEFNKFNFTIYGTGGLFKKYTSKIKDFSNVNVYEQNLNHKEIKALHDKNGIFLYPKRGDSQGVSRCEAMCSGLVSIASDIEGIGEFSPKETTYLVNDLDDFVNALLYIYNNPKDYLEKSKNGSEFIKEKCSYNNTIMKEIEILKR